MGEEVKNWIQLMIERESLPKPLREGTIEDFSKQHGISSETYFYQRRKKENKGKIVEIWLSQALDGGNEVLNKLKENALEGKEKSIEMYLKFVMELAENLDIKTDGEKIASVDLDELLTIYAKKIKDNNKGTKDTSSKTDISE